jgi:ribonuclease E
VDRVLLINADEPEEVRVAVVADGKLEELYVEAGADPVGKGNVYVGRVQNVERGIGAAFVDLSGGVTGFLHESDIRREGEAANARAEDEDDEGPEEEAGAESPAPPAAEGGRPEIGPEADADAPAPPADVPPPAIALVSEEADDSDDEEPLPPPLAEPVGDVAAVAAADAPPAAPPRGRRRGRRPPRKIEDLLKPGDDVLVQVSRGPIGQKGPALTTRISLPGRYLVLLAHATRSGVSRRIESAEERDRARSLLGGLEVPDGMGVILRTAAAGRTKEEIAADLAALLRLWEAIRERLASGSGPRVVHSESDLALRAVRDLLPPDTTRIVVDDPATAERVRGYLERLAAPATPGETPPRMPTVEAHEGPQPLFHAHGIEAQVEDAFRRTVRLPSGGSLVIDPTEALVAIDVNSGRLTEEADLETTALKTDLEAVPEVARQLRLRDLGGVIVVDFIDLSEPAHVHEVEAALREALKPDRARIRVAKMGPFGCLELTRQRIRPALSSVTHVPCPSCQGTGRRRTPIGLALRVLREIRWRAARSRGQGGLEVRVSPAVADVLRTRKARSLRAIEGRVNGPLRIVPDQSLPHGGWSMKGLPGRPPPVPAPQPARGGESA